MQDFIGIRATRHERHRREHDGTANGGKADQDVSGRAPASAMNVGHLNFVDGLSHCMLRNPHADIMRWRLAPTKAGSKQRPDAWLHVRAPGYGGSFEAIKTTIPCGQRDYSSRSTRLFPVGSDRLRR
jgi:hypothetical protein